MEGRLAELAAKKQRLEELRLQKRLREQERQAALNATANDRNGLSTLWVNNILAGVGIRPSDEHNHNSVSNAIVQNENVERMIESNGVAPLTQRRPCHLELQPNISLTIMPKNDVMSYCKTTQTDEDRVYTGEFSMGSQELAFDDEMSLDENSIAPPVYDESPSREIRKHLKALQFNPNQAHVAELLETINNDITLIKVPDLSEEEKRQIITNSDFVRFFQRQARVIERAIAEENDIFIDYVNGPLLEDKVDKHEMLVLNRDIADEKSTTNRLIRALDYSTFYPELLAVAYDRNIDQPLAPEGIVNVWNTRFKTSPEMIFHSSSQITSMLFDEFQSNIIIGGCYSGQICIWDTRANKRNPVCRTQLPIKAHTQPILCMKMVGSQNAHDLVTVSTDGRLCSWSVDNLQAPIDSTNLLCKNKKPATALSMSFFHSDINNFVIGSEENCLYIGDRHTQKGGVNRTIPAHDLPVSSVDLHHVPGGTNDFSSLCLSGSMDFSVKLWDLKDPNPEQVLLLSIERKHKFYIVDVQWSPVHPAVFVSASADGTLHLWNLNANIESPIATVHVRDSIRKVLWAKNGQQLTVGDGNGRVLLYDVHESLYNVRNSEFDDFSSLLLELKASCNEQLTATA